MSGVSHAVPGAAEPLAPSLLRRYKREVSVGAVYLLLLLLLGILHPGFFRAAAGERQSQFFSVAVAASPILIMAVGMALIIIARHIDISIGSQLAVCSVIAGLATRAGLPMPLVIALTIALGAAMGAINGLLVSALSLPSIVATLATMVLFRETLRWTRQGQFVSDLPDRFQWFGLSQLGGQWVLIGVALGVFALFAWVMGYVSAGRMVYAVGSDLEAARLAGLRPPRVVFWLFVLMGSLVGLAAMLNAVRAPDVDPNIGLGWELTVIAAVVVGGVAITGGRGTLAGTLLGVALLSTLAPALEFFGVPAHWEKAVRGMIILIAVAFDGLYRR